MYLYSCVLTQCYIYLPILRFSVFLYVGFVARQDILTVVEFTRQRGKHIVLMRTMYHTAHLEDVISFVDHLGSLFSKRGTTIVTRALARMKLQREVGWDEEEAEQDQGMGRVIEEGVDAIASLEKMLPRLTKTLEVVQESLVRPAVQDSLTCPA